MKILLFLFCLTSTTFADHWYQIAVKGSNSATMLTGSSSLDSLQMAKYLSGQDPIVLENLREVFARSSDEPMKWHSDDSAIKVLIPPQSILFLKELPGDPMVPR